MSDVDDLEEIALSRRMGTGPTKRFSAKLMRQSRKNLGKNLSGNLGTQPKWLHQLHGIKSHGSKLAPVTLSSGDSGLIDNSMRMKISAAMESDR